MNDSSNTEMGYYVVIPAKVMHDPDLKANEILLYGEISRMLTSKGYCYASSAYLARLRNVKSVDTVRAWIRHLKAKGYIEVEVIRNEKQEVVERRIYVVDNPIRFIEKCEAPSGVKNTDPPVQITKKHGSSGLNNTDPPGEKTTLYIRKINKREKEGHSPSTDDKNQSDKMRYGEFGNVMLTGAEHDKLVDRYGEQAAKNEIEKLSCYIESHGKKYRSHYATLLNWMRKDNPNGDIRAGNDGVEQW